MLSDGNSHILNQVAVLATLIERLLENEVNHQITKFHALKPRRQSQQTVNTMMIYAHELFYYEYLNSRFMTAFLDRPQITIIAYLERIEKYANCSPSCFVVSLIYIDRLCQRSVMTLSLLNVHRILITAICVSFMYP